MGNPLSQNLYTYVHNNPLIYADPTGNWCTSADGKWSHPGACNSSTSTYSNDMLHDGDLIKNGRNFVGPLQTFSYSVEYRYARWKAGEAAAFESASDSVRQQLAYMAKSDWTWSDAVKWFSAGVLTGVVLSAPAAGIAALEVASTGTFTYQATTFAGGASVIAKILAGAKSAKTIPALNNLALKALERPNSTYITGIIRADGTIEAHLNVMGSTSHKALGLTKRDVGFNMSYYDGQWTVSGSGLAGPPNNWPKPSSQQIDYLKTMFGVK